jgi:hypothetical protein
MTELPLPHKVAKTVEGGIVFLIGEKIVSSDFGGATQPRLQNTWRSASSQDAWARPANMAPDTWREGKPARLAAALGWVCEFTWREGKLARLTAALGARVLQPRLTQDY